MLRILPALLIFSFCAHAQTYTGFKQLKEFDSSRTFDTLASSPMHKRPVKIDLFYPSSTVKGKPMLYGDFLDMYTVRLDYNVNVDSAKRVSREVANMLGEYLKLDSGGQYLNYQTSVYADLPFPTKKYPLIIYAAGMNGSTWENVILFDSLCKAGYVVAAVSSVGLYPGFMSTAPDILEQVNDVLFADKKISAMPFVDAARVGLLSWSLGGSAVTKAVMANPHYKCLLSYDGTETHYYGSDSAWDVQFDEMNVLKPADPSAINIPYLYISSDRQKAEKMYNIFDHVSSKEKFFVKIDGGTHEHFSSIVTIANNVKPEARRSEFPKTKKIWELTRIFFDQYLKGSSATTVQQYISGNK